MAGDCPTGARIRRAVGVRLRLAQGEHPGDGGGVEADRSAGGWKAGRKSLSRVRRKSAHCPASSLQPPASSLQPPAMLGFPSFPLCPCLPCLNFPKSKPLAAVSSRI